MHSLKSSSPGDDFISQFTGKRRTLDAHRIQCCFFHGPPERLSIRLAEEIPPPLDRLFQR